jgi:ferredoxin-NADP reductase
VPATETYANVTYGRVGTLEEMTQSQSKTQRAVVRGVRRLARLLATPLVPADYLDLIDPLNGSELRGRIVARRRETPDAVSLEIRPGHAWQGHQPGQHVRFGVDVNGVRHWRTYSITSAPGGPTFTITPKRILGGTVSTHLVEHAGVGELVRLEAATGDFAVPNPPPPGVLLVTAGSGITPILGMLRAGLAAATDIVWLHSDRAADSVIAGEEVRELARETGMRLIERHTRTQSRLTVADLTAAVPDWATRQTWACGPAELLELLSAHWAERGVEQQLHIERFAPPPRPVVGEGGTVRFTRTAVDADAPADRSLLEVGEAAGILMPSGCRMGICHGCLTPLRSGAVRDLRTGALITAPEGDPIPVQTCVTAAAGACDLDR